MNLSEEGALERFRSARVGETELQGRTPTDGGATERAVQRHGRWRSPASMSPYVDEAERFDDTNPTRFLGL